MREGEHLEINPEEVLQSRSQEEEKLWELIEEADRPIRTTLKRMNRILKDSFPTTDIQTTESCSGHIQENESISYRPILPEFVDKVPKIGEALFLLLHSSADKTSPTQKRGIKEILDGLFLKAIEATNQSLGKKCIDLLTDKKPRIEHVFEGPKSKGRKKYAFSFHFPILEEERAFLVLQNFWLNIERGLGEIDGLQIESSYKAEDFHAPPIEDPYMVRPK